MAGLPERSDAEAPADSTFVAITGASSGIGACFARALANRGRNIVLVARSKVKLDALKAEITSKHNVRVEVIAQDLGVVDAARRVVEALAQRDIEVELLINNAGFGAHGRFWELRIERQMEMLRLNIATLTELTYLLLPTMVKQRRGGIINLASTASFQPVPYLTVYAATKAYILSFSMGLAEELREHNIKVLAVCPGATDTNFFVAGEFGKVDFRGGLQSPEAVVGAALRAYESGASLIVTRWINRLMIMGERLVPLRFAAQQAGKLFRPKTLEK